MALASKRADPARCSLPSPLLRSAGWHPGWHNCRSWGQVQNRVGWNLWPAWYRRSAEVVRASLKRSICAALALRCSGLPRLKLESLLPKIIPAKWYFNVESIVKLQAGFGCMYSANSLLSICLRDFGGELSAAFLSFVMLALYSFRVL